MNTDDEIARVLIDQVQVEVPGAVELARVVSLAALVEPELLRKARLTLLPHIDAGAEADLWFSPLVQAQSPLAMVLDTEVARVLRRQLAADAALLERAWQVIQEVHQGISPAVFLEEEITWLALSGKPGVKETIEQRLQSVVAALVQENRRGLARWAVRALPGLPDEVLQVEAAWKLAASANALSSGVELQSLPAGQPVQDWLSQVLLKELPTVKVGVRLLDGSVEFADPGLEGAHLIELPRTDPLLLELSWEGESGLRVEHVSWSPGETRLVESGAAYVRIRTALGDVYGLHAREAQPKIFKLKDQSIDFSGLIAEKTFNFAGRDWLLEAVDSWLADPNAVRAFWLLGGPGSGKTAFSAHLVQSRSPQAYHFFVANRSDTLSPGAFIRSIMYRLSHRLEPFQRALDQALQSSQMIDISVQQNVQSNFGEVTGVFIESLESTRPPQEEWQTLVLEPLKQMYAGGFKEQVWILVDGLTDAVNAGSQVILDLLARAIELPAQVRFLFTSREDPRVLSHLESLQPAVRYTLDTSAPENVADARRYLEYSIRSSSVLRKGLEQLGLLPEAFVQQALATSEGNFLYLKYLLDGIESGRIISLEALPVGLEGIYIAFLRETLANAGSERWSRVYRPFPVSPGVRCRPS
jgi:hypothetical protein